MRAIHALPLAAFFALAACGGSSDNDAGESEMSAEDVANSAAALPQPRAGQYETTLELVEFDAPGAPSSMKDTLRSAAASGFAQGNSFCLTPEEAAEGSQRMVQNLAENDCTFNRFAGAGGTIDADMTCKGENGTSNHVTMAGKVEAEKSDMTMGITQPIPAMGDVKMTIRVKSRRVGECS